jgi:hypothetical protein
MELILNRVYFPEGVQGQLERNGELICYTIELPWLENQRRISCIPEGKYVLLKRFSLKYGWHFHLQTVPGRDYILIHPANDAKKELMGCIAPVMKHSGIGKGIYSRKALEKLKSIVFPVLEKGEKVVLTITSKVN